MPFGITAGGWAAIAGGVGAIGGALISSDAAGDAADQQAQSSAAAIGEQRRQFDLTRADSQPYRETGARALGQLESDINTPTTAADVMSDPGYAFGLQQGQQALDRKAAAQGGRVSGASLKAAMQYGTNYAASGYSAAYQRKQDRLNRLAALAGIGQTSTASSAAAGASSSNAIGNLMTGQGNAAGAASIAQGNIWQNATNQLSAAAQRWARTPTQYDGFNVDANGGYTNQQPWAVGPQQ